MMHPLEELIHDENARALGGATGHAGLFFKRRGSNKIRSTVFELRSHITAKKSSRNLLSKHLLPEMLLSHLRIEHWDGILHTTLIM